MDFKEYREKALRTVNPECPDLQLNAMLGLCGEVGEVSEHIKKHRFHGKPFDSVKYRDELGDVLWYLNAAAEADGTTLEAIAERNIEKLEERHPYGFRPIQTSI